MSFKKICICLILIFCIIGAASAADDVSMDAVDASVDDAVIADAVIDDTDDSTTVEDTPVDTISDDAATEEISEETQTDEISEESADVDSEPTRTTITNWGALKDACGQTTAQTIDLSGVITATEQITIKNSVTITGSSSSYITGGSTSYAPFVCTQSGLTTTFKNIQFKNMNVLHLCQFSGTNIFENCTFINITTGNDHHSVLYNTWGTMNVTGCNFTNCTTGYGVITNYNWMSQTGVILNVKNSRFENNHALYEPGAINNCGILTVYNCTFNNNSAELWGGAIHTHSNANTVINMSTFKNNEAEWNGGALFTYSVLKVYNSLFENNVCHSDTGGGAIGAYNYGSTYDIYIKNCTFINNTNDCTGGHGGAITALNGGYLNVYNSRFINNHADIGQAICGFNQHIENGTNDTPYLGIVGCNFTNHTGSSDTVYVDGTVNLFKNNRFVNSTQNTHFPGSGNTYNSIINPIRSNSKELLGASYDNILTDFSPHQIIYVDPSSDKDAEQFDDEEEDYTDGSSWDCPYGLTTGFYYAFQNIGPNGNIRLANGEYIFDTYYSDWRDRLAQHFCTITGYGDNVRFVFPEGYDLDFTKVYNINDGEGGTISTLKTTITHENIIFDCDVKVGSRNFKFINCTFNKGLTLSHDYESDDIFEMTFEKCTFANPKSDIAIANKVTASFDDACVFPVTAVDSVVDISSTEKGVVVVTLTDNSSAPIANAPFKYSVNGGDEQTATTGDDGKYSITGLTGEVTIAVTYDGNESYNPVSGSESFNFTDEPAPSNDTNGSNSTPVPPAKVATKLTASKVTATYNVAKKLVITLKDANGKALANKKVTVKVGTISKTLKTNAKGQVSLNVATLVPKTYTATVKFAGDSSYSASTVKPKVVVNKAKVKLAAKAKTFKVKAKVKKYTATLKNNKGKVMKNTKLTLKIGKKTYTAKTNKKGVATFKVKLTKKGKNTATLKFAGNKYFKALSKKVKITVKK